MTTTVFQWWLSDRMSRQTKNSGGGFMLRPYLVHPLEENVKVLDLFPKFGEGENRRILRALNEIASITQFWSYYAEPGDTGLGITIEWRQYFMETWKKTFQKGPFKLTFEDEKTILTQDLDYMIEILPSNGSQGNNIIDLKSHFLFARELDGDPVFQQKFQQKLEMIRNHIPQKIREEQDKLQNLDNEYMREWVEKDIEELKEIQGTR